MLHFDRAARNVLSFEIIQRIGKRKEWLNPGEIVQIIEEQRRGFRNALEINGSVFGHFLQSHQSELAASIALRHDRAAGH